jgi:hypothetical protein
MTKPEELESLRKLRGLIIGVMSEAVDYSALESYTHGEADGTQSVKRRSPKELMDWLNEVDKKIAVLERGMQGGGIMSFGVNRYV